jgi:hypothetical protein
MYLKHILVGFTPSIVLPLLPFLLLRIISAGFILLFSYMETKYVHCIHPYSPFPCVHLSPLGTHLQKRFIFPSCPSFALVIFEINSHFIPLTA